MSLNDLFSELDSHFGRGPTYSRHDAEQILDGVIPEWLYRGRKLLQGTPDGARCEKAIDHLKGLHAAVWPKVEFPRSGA